MLSHMLGNFSGRRKIPLANTDKHMKCSVHTPEVHYRALLAFFSQSSKLDCPGLFSVDLGIRLSSYAR